MMHVTEDRSARTPRLLFLGGGAVVAELHLPALQRLAWADHALIVESLPQSMRVLRERDPSLAIKQANYREVFQDPGLSSSFEAAVIALPNNLHEDATLRCLQAGLHVLCEKPLAMNSEACLRLAREAERSERILSVGMVRRLVPVVTAIRKAIQTGLIGDIRDVEVQHGGRFTWPSDSGHYFRKEHGGILVNMGVHYLDMIEDWLGPLTPALYKDDCDGGVEANCDFRLSTVAGANVRIVLSHTHELPNSIVVVGTRGRIVADVSRFDTCTWRSSGGAGGTLQATRPFVNEDWPSDFISSFAQQLVDFMSAIHRGTKPQVDGYRAASTTELVEWAYDHRRPLQSTVARPTGRARPLLARGPAVVTGGTGFLGSKLVERLAELEFRDIRVPVRSYRSGANVARFAVERNLTELLSRESVEQAVRGARYVFHLAYGTDGKDASRVTVQGTKNVIDAAVRNKVEAVVVVSTASVFGHPKASRPIDESFPYRPALGAYGRSKAAAEKYCLIKARSSGNTRIVVVNPAAIYGPGGKLFTEFPARAAKDGYFAWIENGNGKLNYTFVDNVVDAILLAAQCAEAHGQRFIISDGVCTCREFLGPILAADADSLRSYSREELVKIEAGRRPAPRDFLRVLASDEMMTLVNRTPLLAPFKRLVAERLGSLYRHVGDMRKSLQVRPADSKRPEAGTPPVWLADVFGPLDIEFSAEKARRVLGWQPLVSLSEGHRQSVEWLEYLGLRPCGGGRSAEEACQEDSC
jgi:nucleoside-diphosphate-sugar epimerase/predicted dehydrogenase